MNSLPELLIYVYETLRKEAMLKRVIIHLSGQKGALSAEYATVGIAACGAAGILYKFLTSSSFAALLSNVLEAAFSWVFNLL